MAVSLRYYGNKEKLFAAAATFDLRLPSLTGVPKTEYGPALVRHFLDRWESDGTFVALLRAAVTNEAARDQMRDIFVAQLAPVVATLCPAPAAAPDRAGLIASQMFGLALCRYVLRLPPITAMPAEKVVEWISPTLQRYLTGPEESLTA
ncbi:TetR/AcrR family transcriptional regulator [Rhizomonospora bruguierae]|uniref:TetR/AcrR family transcriptional regulator n=1 Tax=Rhizomonospora bruguierae TaxID=1581705 RepID=UPI001BCD6248|nr:TetR/AcrR family transcriptional regulator [Micromonospora sp. NBRC 107566]